MNFAAVWHYPEHLFTYIWPQLIFKLCCDAALATDLSANRKVGIRLPGKGNSNSHGARPVHQIISMIKLMRTSRLSIKNSLSVGVQRHFLPPTIPRKISGLTGQRQEYQKSDNSGVHRWIKFIPPYGRKHRRYGSACSDSTNYRPSKNSKWSENAFNTPFRFSWHKGNFRVDTWIHRERPSPAEIVQMCHPQPIMWTEYEHIFNVIHRLVLFQGLKMLSQSRHSLTT